MSNVEDAWFVAQIKPNAEQIAERNLTRQGFAVFRPLENRTVRVRGNFVTAARPMFPGYLFVRFRTALGGWRAINATRGVSRLVGFGSAGPAALPEGLVDGLRARCDDSGTLAAPDGFSSGDRVRFLTGPFADALATVEQAAPEQRIWVLIDLMGRKTRMAADPTALAST